MSTRRRLMIQSGGGGIQYITDQIAFWLDGYEFGLKDGAFWRDKVMGWALNYNSGNGHMENGRVYGNVQNSSTNPIQNLNFNPNTCTMEIVFCVDVLPSSRILQPIGFGASNGNYVLNLRYGNVQYKESAIVDKTIKLEDSDQGKPIILGISNGVIVKNGIVQKTISSSWTGTTGQRIIGFIEGQGYICAIRIYDRLLTADEMINNQIVDNEYYKLGLDMPQ